MNKPDRNGVEKLHFRMMCGLWVAEADGITGIGETPQDAQSDWTFEFLESCNEPYPTT